MRNGVDLDVAFELDDLTRTAWAINFSEMDGNEFDWQAMDWKKREDTE